MIISKRARFLAAIAASLALGGCGTDGPLDPSRLPPLPPAGGFNADFSFFGSTTPGTGGTTAAWSAALGRVAAADDEMTPILAVPFAAMTDAATATPRRSGTVWSWPLDFTVDGEPYEGDLRGSVAGGNYGWDLVLTAPTHTPVLTSYLWMSGFSGPTVQEGIWYIADADEGTDQAVASMSWERSSATEASFAFSSTDSTVWAYQRDGGTITLTWLVHGQQRHVTVWTPSNGTGSTWSASNGITLCWNSSQQDVTC